MKQSRGTSLIKSLVNTGVGFAVAMIANAAVLPFFGWTPSLKENLVLTTVYTVISIARGYALERFFEALGWRTRMSAFALAVLAERQRQITHEGHDPHHDDQLVPAELALAGAGYAIGAEQWLSDAIRRREHRPLVRPDCWPWRMEDWKPTGFRRDLIKSASLIIAEGERFDRNRKQGGIAAPPVAYPPPESIVPVSKVPPPPPPPPTRIVRDTISIFPWRKP